MTITKVMIKTPDRKWTGVGMTSCPEVMGWEFSDFEKDVSWDPTQGRASPAGGYRMCSTFVGSDSTVGIVKILSLSLSLCRKTKVKKLINVLYLIISMYIWQSVYLCFSRPVSLSLYIYIYIYMYKQTHTHTHTHINLFLDVPVV